jgi:hypothetical protein
MLRSGFLVFLIWTASLFVLPAFPKWIPKRVTFFFIIEKEIKKEKEKMKF